MTPNIAIVLADDHAVVRQGIRAVLEAEEGLTVVGEASDGPEALALVERATPDVLVLDLFMPRMSGLEVMRQLVARSAKTRVVVLSMHASEAYVIESLRAGALAYVPKSSGADELIRGIREAAAGRQYLGKPLSQEGIAGYVARSQGASRDSYSELTPREREVLRLTAAGETSGGLALLLKISPRTADKHRANLMRKLRLSNRSELVHYALSRGLIGDLGTERP